MAGCQIAGALIALSLHVHEFAPIALWMGGAYASPFGFAAGWLWQKQAREPAASWLVATCAIGAVLLPLVALTFPWQNLHPRIR